MLRVGACKVPRTQHRLLIDVGLCWVVMRDEQGYLADWAFAKCFIIGSVLLSMSLTGCCHINVCIVPVYHLELVAKA